MRIDLLQGTIRIKDAVSRNDKTDRMEFVSKLPRATTRPRSELLGSETLDLSIFINRLLQSYFGLVGYVAIMSH